MLTITLKLGREKSLLRRHPWIFPASIDRIDGKPEEKSRAGATALVKSASGQFLARAAWSPKSQIRARIWSFDETGCPNVYERSDASVREREGLPLVTGVLAGAEPGAQTAVTENGVHYAVDIKTGHKTGFYVDQRENRALVMAHAGGREVLNCFCYTGGFSLAALKGDAASVISIDSSGEALAVARHNMALNGFADHRAEWRDADVFKTLRALREQGRTFDMIVLDPPKFAASPDHVERAARAYKDINLLGFQLLREGGLLFTYSCSGAISADLFQKIVAGAASDARADARILRRLSAGVDHPTSTSFPEGEYLKGLLLYKA